MATVEFDIHHESNKSHVKEIEQEKIILDNFVWDLTEKVKFTSSKTNAVWGVKTIRWSLD